jgi:acetylglutamate kinase
VIIVLKVGGGVDGAVERVRTLRARGVQVAVVHGAGPRISARCREAGIEPQFIGGWRVTDLRVLRIVAEAIAEEGAALTAQMAAAGVDVRRLDDVLDGERLPDEELGLVGRVVAVDRIGIRAVLAAGAVPLISPMASGLNVNADHAAAAVAAALGASELAFLSDVPGVLDGAGAVIRRIGAGDVHGLIAGGHVTGGMIPKLQAGMDALAQGVWRVWIGSETMVTA